MFITESIVITVISTVGALGVAVIPSYLSNRRKTEELSHRIGEPNGHKSIVSMLEEVLGLLRDHSKRITRLEEKMDELHGRN